MPADLSLIELMRRQEAEQREYVTLIMRKNSIREAARRMGVSKSTLHNMMKRLGLVRSALREFDVSGRSLPDHIEDEHVRRWEEAHSFFQGVSHHTRLTKPDEFATRV